MTELETRVAVLEANHSALAKAIEDAIGGLREELRWIRNTLVGTVMIGILFALMGIMFGKL